MGISNWRILCLISGLVVCASAAQTSQAAGKVEGFESGDPPFSSIGDAGNAPQEPYQGITPPEGSVQFLLTTVGPMHNEDLVPPQSGSYAVTNLQLENFLGVTLNGQEGSAVLIPFTVSEGDGELTFQFDFLSNENFQMSPKNDFAFATLSDSNGLLQAATIASVFGSTFSVFDPSNSSPFQFHTGYETFSFSVAGLDPGNYSLGIGVEDFGSPDHASGLLIDNVQLVAAVPEPSPISLSIAGAIMLMAVRRRIKRA